MIERLETRKYTFTVEGETEQWYLNWLQGQINSCPERTNNVKIASTVQQSPKKFYKGTNAKTTPKVTHICDVESNEQVHVDKFQRILSEMKEAGEQKGIKYDLGYSNFTFELWMILHRNSCNGSLIHRRQYLEHVNRAYGEEFENLDHFKHRDSFHRCLGKLTLEDVKEAIQRADNIMANNAAIAKPVVRYKGYAYYRDNPALTIHDAVKLIMTECGLI